jgi:serine/threonine protein kinase/Tol biopolymer transport system component
MSLSVGSRLSAYEIVAAIGAGGMGEVYRAKDTKLGRDVALKILPASFTNDPERVARFRREAQVLASLNHPHIAQIHGLDEVDGTQFLVLELVDGESLDKRIARGRIPVDEALGIAKQIAEALEAAHEKGIIHRDLKPANIALTKDGSVKVLDFGLAKAVEATSDSSVHAMNSPTITSPAMMTRVGVILGTAAYMSPEQAKGRAADKRSDVWAFGCVLYEMLSSKRAFEGEDVSDALANVLKREPDYSRLPADVPASILSLLRLCLIKEVSRRRQSAGDVRIDIEQAIERKEASVAGGRMQRLFSTSVPAWVVVIASVLAAAVFAAIRPRRMPDTSQLAMRVEINTPAPPLAFALSPDGRYLAFVASGDGPQRLWLRPLDKTDAQPLAGTEGAFYPFWSPDSRSIGFFASGQLRRVDIGGGQPQDIAQAIEGGATWNAEGVILFIPSRGSPLSRVSASGGRPVAVTRLDPPRQTSHLWPHFLPDGRHFLFVVAGIADVSGIYLGSLDGDEPKRITTNFWAGEYLPPGLLVTVRQGAVRQGALVAQKLDLKRGELTGDPITLAFPVDYAPGFFEGFSVTANGLVAYRASGNRQQLTWVDRTGRSLGVAGEADATLINYPELSPDDRMIAVQREVQTNTDIWLLDTIGAHWNRFTFDAALDVYPLWSPDGGRLAFASSRQRNTYDLYWKASNGAGADELLRQNQHPKFPQDWSKDGRYLLYSETDPKTQSDLWVLEMAGSERKARAFVNTPFDERMGTFSPDGRWVAYETNESGQSEIVVTPFPNPNGRWQVSEGGGRQARWRADGKELYFIASDGKLMAVPVSSSGSAFEARAAVPLFQVRIVSTSASAQKPQYAVARDGRFLINQPLKEAAVTPITLLMNWNPDTQK